MKDWSEARDSQVPPPTEAHLEWYKGEADQKIGGEASATVDQFGRAAIKVSDFRGNEAIKILELQMGLAVVKGSDPLHHR